MSELYVIRKRGYFYRPNARGYTACPAEAWRVPLHIAKKYERPGDQPVTIYPASEYPIPAPPEPTYTAEQVKELVEALRAFMGGDDNMHIAIGGNPNYVGRFLANTHETLKQFGEV